MEEFQRWREGEPQFSPVRLSLDPDGFFLYEFPFQQSILGAAKPKYYDLILVSDSSPGHIRRNRGLTTLMEQLAFETSASRLEDCYFCLVTRQPAAESSVHYFVCPSYTYFLHPQPETVESWCRQINVLSFNQDHINGDIFCFLRKLRRQLLFEVQEKSVRYSDIIRVFGVPRDQEKTMKGKLSKLGVTKEGEFGIGQDKITEDFMWQVYLQLCPRPEIDKIFLSLLSVERSQDEFLTFTSLLKFLNNTQWDPRVNPQLVQKLKERHLRDMLKKLSISTENKTITRDDFQKYLQSYLSSVLSVQSLKRRDSMEHPLNSYFINSSHNTYLTGNQLKSHSTVEMYIQILLLGARCIELDCWDSATGEPVITHGKTFCTKIPFEEVVRAIGEFAFLKSDLPVILSFENHCSPSQQQMMARFCWKYFGEQLCSPLPSHPTTPGTSLPSPLHLRGKIIIKNKKVRQLEHAHSLSPMRKGLKKQDSKKGETRPPSIVVNANIEEKDTDEWEGVSFVDTDLSDLVNYVEPVKFKSIDDSLERDRRCEMSSFSEVRALLLLQHEGAKFVQYNSEHNSRIYPSGSRISSSNYMPQLYWNVGCQMVALNFQTPDLSMLINQAKFELGANCGYLLKPDILRVERGANYILDPFTQSPPENTVPTDCGIRVVSAQLLGPTIQELTVHFELFGLPADTHRGKGIENRTRSAYYNGIWAVWDDEHFIKFEEIFSQELALIKISILDESGGTTAHRILPVSLLQNGYRHIYLRDRFNLPLGLASLFVEVSMDDHVTKGLEGYVDVLENPEQLARRGSLAAPQLELSVFKREAIRSLIVGEGEVDELQELIREEAKNLSPMRERNSGVQRLDLSKSSLSVSTEELSGRNNETSSPIARSITPIGYARSFDYGNVEKKKSMVQPEKTINHEYIPAILSIQHRETIAPQRAEAVISTNKNLVCKQEKSRKECSASSKLFHKQLEFLAQERDKRLKDILANYGKEIQKVDREMSKKISDQERHGLGQEKNRLCETRDLKLNATREQAAKQIDQIRNKQERDEAQFQLRASMDLKLMAIPFIKASHQSQRHEILEKVHEFEQRTTEKEIETKKLNIINQLQSRTGTLSSVTATQATVRVFVQHQTQELERLHSEESHNYDTKADNIIKLLERDVKELELKFEQFDFQENDQF